MVIPVSLDGRDISLNLSLVEEVVLGKGGSELSWVCEDGSPGLDVSNVIIHAFAGVESLWDLEDSKTELEGALDVVVPATFLNVCDTSLNLLSHELASLEAGFNFGEIVISGHAVHEAGDKVGSAKG